MPAPVNDRSLRNTQDPFMNPAYSLPDPPEPTLAKPSRFPSDSTNASYNLQYSPGQDDQIAHSNSTINESILFPAKPTDLSDKELSRTSEHRRYHNHGRVEERDVASPRQSQRYANYQRSQRHTDDEADVEEAYRIQEENALKILLFLAMPCVALSFLNAMWAVVSLFITIFSQPVRLCARRPSFGQQLGGLLGPSLNLQLKCIYTPLAPHASEDYSYHPWTLMAVQLLSPFLSLGVMAAAWVVAVFWISSLVVGDPSGTDRHDDGSETALALRKFWEKWLRRCIRYD
jgi:hypothetical protein